MLVSRLHDIKANRVQEDTLITDPEMKKMTTEMGTQSWRKVNLHAAMPGTEAPHSFSLNGRHAEQVLSIGQVGRQLCKL